MTRRLSHSGAQRRHRLSGVPARLPPSLEGSKEGEVLSLVRRVAPQYTCAGASRCAFDGAGALRGQTRFLHDTLGRAATGMWLVKPESVRKPLRLPTRRSSHLVRAPA